MEMAVFAGLTTVSTAPQIPGALFYSGTHWNVAPQKTDQHTERLWDGRDPALLRGWTESGIEALRSPE